MRIVHLGALHVLVPAHERGGTPVRSHWRGVPSTWPEDAPVTDGNANNPMAPPTNPGESVLWNVGGKAS